MPKVIMSFKVDDISYHKFVDKISITNLPYFMI